jgi:hypothetical protein
MPHGKLKLPYNHLGLVQGWTTYDRPHGTFKCSNQMVEKKGNISLTKYFENPNDAMCHILRLSRVTFLNYHMSYS